VRGANIIASIAALLWFGLLVSGRNGVRGIVAQRVLDYPNTAQIDLYIVWPSSVMIALLACAWVCNGFRRWPALLALVSSAALLAILPYIMISRGGV
jgi:hypothetical protein